ncbi:MAG: rhomboid family intramembrane serine protease [Micrococcales bacterium]|nr:rhomboid family intramembrane serine protease [Micrococcales bacterium]
MSAESTGSDPSAPAEPRRSAFRERVLRTPVTSALVAVNVLAAIVATASAATVPWSSVGGALLGDATPLHLWGALVPRPTRFSDVGVSVLGVAGGEYWRLATNMFLHFGLLHLALNMYALVAIGPLLETTYGRGRYLTLYLVSGLVGSVAVFCFGGDTLTAGASGAIFGLFGALVPTLRRLGRSLGSIIPVVVVNLGITFLVPGISIAGHLGGLAAGLALGAVLGRWPRWAPAIIGATALTLAVLLVATLVRTLQLSAS